MIADLRAPFPYFGGKSRVAAEVWERFGDVANYVEPFFGSGAVLLGRPTAPKIETVNDLDCFVSNFWRALAADPEGVAFHADWPVNEADLHARHRWLVALPDFRERMRTEPDYHDVKVAGWWVWGLCQWIGSGWCTAAAASWAQLPHLRNAGVGVHRKLPHLGNAGRGVHRSRPHLRGAGVGVHRSDRAAHLSEYLAGLAERLRRVRVCCGDWARVLGPTPTYKQGLTGVFLDPPYGHAERELLYAEDHDVAPDVREWAIANGDNPLLRIALCGYDSEHAMPASWVAVPWKAHGGYAAGNGRARDNAAREVVWFSPACLRPDRPVQTDFLGQSCPCWPALL